MSNQDNTKKIPLTQGKFALVDAEDYEQMMKYNWYAWYKRGHISARRESGKNLAREIMGVPRGAEVMHKNHDGLDCRKSNLQIVSHSEASQHKRLRENKTSKYKGVSWEKQRQKWEAKIYKDGKGYHLGRFDDEEDAAQRYDEKALELYGDTAYLNFSDNNGTPAVVNSKMPYRETERIKSNIGRSDIGSRPYKCKGRSSRFKGVSWHKQCRKWKALIQSKGKQNYLGVFGIEADAARAYDEAAVKMFGEGAYLNFPQKRLKHA